MKPIHDVFVGSLAIILGCFLVAGAISQSPLLMQFTKSRLLVESVGNTAARWIIAVVGLIAIGMGALIASGWHIHW